MFFHFDGGLLGGPHIESLTRDMVRIMGEEEGLQKNSFWRVESFV